MYRTKPLSEPADRGPPTEWELAEGRIAEWEALVEARRNADPVAVAVKVANTAFEALLQQLH